jgi:hypothetical protein
MVSPISPRANPLAPNRAPAVFAPILPLAPLPLTHPFRPPRASPSSSCPTASASRVCCGTGCITSLGRTLVSREYARVAIPRAWRRVRAPRRGVTMACALHSSFGGPVSPASRRRRRRRRAVLTPIRALALGQDRSNLKHITAPSSRAAHVCQHHIHTFAHRSHPQSARWRSALKPLAGPSTRPKSGRRASFPICATSSRGRMRVWRTQSESDMAAACAWSGRGVERGLSVDRPYSISYFAMDAYARRKRYVWRVGIWDDADGRSKRYVWSGRETLT